MYKLFVIDNLHPQKGDSGNSADTDKTLQNMVSDLDLYSLHLPLKRQSRLQQTTFINIFSLFFRESKT